MCYTGNINFTSCHVKHITSYPQQGDNFATSMKSEIGKSGEIEAVNFATKHGYKIRETNFKKPYGEIDIIAEKDRVLHFIEVKTSKYYPNSAFLPEIRVNAKKIRNLKKLCETYLRETRVSQDQPWQIDVISVILNDDDSAREVKLFENAVFEKKY